MFRSVLELLEKMASDLDNKIQEELPYQLAKKRRDLLNALSVDISSISKIINVLQTQ